jgi:SAM-dependent methyltransferase
MIDEQPSNDARRRLKPRLIDTDWLMLRDLRRALELEMRDLGQIIGQTAIDFGCGEQPYRTLFEERGVSYRGADFGSEADLPISAGGMLPADDATADLVLSFQVLEHVRDLDTYLSEARRVVRPDGHMLLSTHGTWLYHPHPEDHRRWTRTGLVHDLELRGWRVESCSAVVGPLALTTIVRSTGFCYVLRRLPLIGRACGAVLAAIMNVRALIEDSITPASIRDDNACIYLVRATPVPVR